MARKRPEHPPVMRTDLLMSNLTASKRVHLLDLVAAYRAGAVLLGREQWRLFFETGRLHRDHDVDKATFAAVIGAANRVQMARYQVVGQLQGWIGNRAHEFRVLVTRSSLAPDVRHALHVINKSAAWFRRGDISVKGVVIADDVRRLARSIMRRVMRRHRRPDVSRISMRLDHRAACLSRPKHATQRERVGWWVRLSTLVRGQTIALPLLGYGFHEKRVRQGRVTNGLQVNLSREGVLSFGVVTDMGAACARSRAAYDGDGAIALDFGLCTLFATSAGQLLGQGWLRALRRYDALLSMIAASQQRAGRKPRDSRRYRALVVAVRGFLRTEVGRVLNRLVAEGRPRELILERLDFRNPSLSRRLNAILRNCGRSVIQAKLLDLEQRFGITSTGVNPAYSSQTCAVCGYVDKRNRRAQDSFRCLWCGHVRHADLNAASGIGQRRALAIGSVFLGKAAVLAELVRRFRERHTGSRGAPADPRPSNPYFTPQAKPAGKGSLVAVRSPSVERPAKLLVVQGVDPCAQKQ